MKFSATVAAALFATVTIATDTKLTVQGLVDRVKTEEYVDPIWYPHVI
jgi:hypothetical protein